MADQPRRPRTLNDARTEAEAAFKKTTTKVPELPPKKVALPNVKELVSLRIDQDPILVTALNALIGYEKGAAIAKKAYKEGRPIREVAEQETKLSREELARLLDPTELTRGGIKGGGGGAG